MMYRWATVVFVSLTFCFFAQAHETIVTIDPSITYQEIEGFGASLTDSSAWLIQNKLSPAARSNLLVHLFCPTNGAGLNFLRQPIGSSDFRLQDYTYDDMPFGQTDYGLTNFSIAYDEAYIIPLLQKIATLNTNLKIMASSWSPPAWMKNGGDLYSGTLKTNAYGAYAAYLRKFIHAYTAHGLPIHSLTLQNEPLYEPNTYAGSYMAASNQIELIKRVGSDFATNAIATKILVYDHNWDQFNYPITVLNDAGAAAYAAGSAFHGYAGDISVQSLVRDAHPTKDIYFTECSSGSWSGSFSNSLLWDAQTLIIGSLRHWSKTVIKWNLALDQNGGPKIAGGCSTCRGLVTINTNTSVITTNSEYYALGHASRFLRLGARRIEASETAIGGPYTVAFVNPDTSMVAIACNPNTSSRDFTFRWSGQSFTYTLPAKSVATFTWPNTAGATVEVWLTTGDMANLLKKQTVDLKFHPISFEWKGRTWNVRDTLGDPDANQWSAQCVSVDGNDYLRLSVKNIGDTWYCGGVESADSLGHGVYRWQTVGRPDLLDSNVVAGLGMHSPSLPGLDIEFTRAYVDAPTNLFYTVQPYYISGHRNEGAHSFTGSLTTHEFRWAPRQVQYRSWYGHTDAPASTSALISAWTYEGDDIPPDTNEVVRMMMWMFNGQSPLSSQELVLADFSYEPVSGTFVSDDFEDGTLSNIWVRYNDPGSTRIVESGGRLQVTPAVSDDDSLGVRTDTPLSWGDDGMSYLFSAHLATVSVTLARSSGGADAWAYHALIQGPGTSLDPYAASNAAILRAGYDASADELTVEFLTKRSSPGTWGNSRYIGTISSASSFFNNSGIELRFSLVYSNYSVAALYQDNPISITTVSGSSTGLHSLSELLFSGHYCVGAQNHENGRGAAQWEEVSARAVAELPSTAGGNGEEGPGTTVIQLGNGSGASTWNAPLDSTYTRHRAQVLYRRDDIGRSGPITQLLINVLSAPDITIDRYTIRMRHTMQETVDASFLNSGWTTVHVSNVSMPSGTRGWYGFGFSTSFVYDARSNLLVDFVFDNSPYKDNSPVPAASYSPTDYKACFVVSADRDAPLTWTTPPNGKKYTYNGNRIIDIRLAFPYEPPPPLGDNLSFEDGAEGFITNVPSWSVKGSVYAGAIRSSSAIHGRQSLKLWKGEGTGDQSLYQAIKYFAASNQYNLSGYILSENGEPFSGENACGALLLEWYGTEGLLRTDESARFDASYAGGVWHPFSISAVPPVGTTSGRFSCALFSSPDQAGSLFFDRLALTATPASPGSGGIPLSRTYALFDNFNDNTMSNIWIRSGDFGATVFQETDGCFRIRPGTNWQWQSSGYVSASPIPWSNSNAWHVFSATLSTIKVDSVSGGNDIETLLAICSEQDNPWWSANSVGLYGYYNASEDSIHMQLLTKTNAAESTGTERFNGTINSVSRYLNATNGLRISIALGQGQYDLRFNDRAGLPVPVAVNFGSSRAPHNLGETTTNAYWYIGAQNDDLRRGTVYWDETAIYGTHAPAGSFLSVAQTSSDGTGIVTISNEIWDVNGDFCRLGLEGSINNGSSWFPIFASSIAHTLPAALAPSQTGINAFSIQTTNNAGVLQSNLVAFTWDTKGAGFDGLTLTNVRLRLRVDDGDVGFGPITSIAFAVDNEAPESDSATLTVEGGATWTLNTTLSATWSGFADAGSEVAGYYYSASNQEGTDSGSFIADTSGFLADAEADATNTFYVWAMDIYGNIGSAAFSQIMVLSESGDFDRDGYSNAAESIIGTDPMDAESWMELQQAMLSGEHLIEWESLVGRRYSVYYTDRLGDAWQPVVTHTNLPGTGDPMSYSADLQNVTSRYYRIGIRLP
jgi:glucosylceramidase